MIAAFQALPIDNIQDYLKKIKRHDNLILLAEKIETDDAFQKAGEMGFNLFQGYFFCKPQLMKGKWLLETAKSAYPVTAKQQFKLNVNHPGWIVIYDPRKNGFRRPLGSMRFVFDPDTDPDPDPDWP